MRLLIMKHRRQWFALATFFLAIGFLTGRPVSAEPAFVGLRVQGVELTIARALGMGTPRGVLVRDVALGGPGDLAGFRRGDLIVEFDGTAIDRFEKLINSVRALDAGAKVAVKVERADGQVSLDLNTVSRPDPWQIPKGSTVRIPNAGLTVVALTLQIREEHGVRWGSTGVLVAAIDANKSTAGAIAPGELLVQVNRQDVWLPEQVAESLKSGSGDRLVLMEGRHGFRFALLPASGEPARPTGGDVANLVAAGIQVETLTPPAAVALGSDGARGVLVRDVIPGSPAAAAGFRRGELISEAGGKAVATADAFADAVRRAAAGSPLEFAVSGPDGEMARTMTAPDASTSKAPEDAFANLPDAGITVATATPETRKTFGLRWAMEGVVVTLVEGATARESDVRRGDMILQVGQRDVRTPGDVVAAYQRAKASGLKKVLLTVENVSGSRFSLLPIR